MNVCHHGGVRRLWILFLLLVVAVTANAVRVGDLLFAAGYLVLGLWIVWWVSPFRGGRTTTHEEILAMPEAQRPVVIYWRPGCGYCQRLKGALGQEGKKAHWVNIWQDDDAAAFVRSVNDGNETVPTVVIDGTPHTNPAATLVRERLAEV